VGGATGTLCGGSKRASDNFAGIAMSAGLWEQEIWGGIEDQVSQRQKPGNELADLVVDGDPSFIVKFSQRDAQAPPILLQMSQAVGSKTNQFPYSHTGGAQEQQASMREVGIFTELLIQETIILWREGLREIGIMGRKILRHNEVLLA